MQRWALGPHSKKVLASFPGPVKLSCSPCPHFPPKGHSLEGDWDRLQLLNIDFRQPKTRGSFYSGLRFPPKDKVLVPWSTSKRGKESAWSRERLCLFCLTVYLKLNTSTTATDRQSETSCWCIQGLVTLSWVDFGAFLSLRRHGRRRWTGKRVRPFWIDIMN